MEPHPEDRMVADKTARTQRRTLRRRTDTAYHEAGHVVAIWLAGGEVASCWIGDDPNTGRTQRALTVRDAGAPGGWRPAPFDPLVHPKDDRDWALDLMADCVDERRGVRYGAHVLEVADAAGADTVPRVLPLARALIETHWSTIEAVAQSLLEAGGELYQDDLNALRVELGVVAPVR